jgi:hypothetical protein
MVNMEFIVWLITRIITTELQIQAVAVKPMMKNLRAPCIEA